MWDGIESPFLHGGYKCGGLPVVVSPLIIQTFPRLSYALPLPLRGKESWLPLPSSSAEMGEMDTAFGQHVP